MGKEKRKIKKSDIVLALLVLAAVAAGLLLPRSGKLVLLDELSGIAAIWIVCIYVILKVIHGWKAGGKSIKTAGVIIAAVCAAVCLWSVKDLAADLVSGTRTVMLTDIEVRESQAHTGIFSHHYYLLGMDPQGKWIHVEISAGDYERTGGNKSAELVYYEHTGRTVSVR